MNLFIILVVIKDLLKVRIHAILNTKVHQLRKKEHEERKRFYSSFLSAGLICFDIGANLGNRTRVFVDLGCEVVAAEPQTKCYYYLKFLFGSKINLVKKGLSSESGSTVMHVDRSTTISSISPDWIESVRQTRFTTSTWSKRESIQLITLEDLISEYGRPSFIKIDVEGHEPQVLQGLRKAVPMLSFEYTTPEQTEKVYLCLDHLERLDPDYLCNFSIGEENKFRMKSWILLKDLKAAIKNDVNLLMGFGDIYVKQKDVIVK